MLRKAAGEIRRASNGLVVVRVDCARATISNKVNDSPGAVLQRDDASRVNQRQAVRRRFDYLRTAKGRVAWVEGRCAAPEHHD